MAMRRIIHTVGCNVTPGRFRSRGHASSRSRRESRLSLRPTAVERVVECHRTNGRSRTCATGGLEDRSKPLWWDLKVQRIDLGDRVPLALRLPASLAKIAKFLDPRILGALDTMKTMRRVLATWFVLSVAASCSGRTANGGGGGTAQGGAESAVGGEAGDSNELPASGKGSSAGSSHGGATGGAPVGQAGTSDAGEGGNSSDSPASTAPRLVTQIATEPEWYPRTSMPGLAVTPQGRIFVATEYKIYEIADGEAHDFLTNVEAYEAVGSSDGFGFGDLGVDQGGTLYATYSGSIIRLSQAHQVDYWRQEPKTEAAPAMRLGVLAVNDVLSLGSEGIWRVEGQEPASPLVAFDDVQNRCSFADFALGSSGTFLIQPDCAHDMLQRGNFDGAIVASVDTVFDSTFPPSGSMGPAKFLCTTADPHGGFYSVVRVSGLLDLYHLSETSEFRTSRIEVTPALDVLEDMASMEGDNQAFRACKLAADLARNVYLQTSQMLLQLTPKP